MSINYTMLNDSLLLIILPGRNIPYHYYCYFVHVEHVYVREYIYCYFFYGNQYFLETAKHIPLNCYTYSAKRRNLFFRGIFIFPYIIVVIIRDEAHMAPLDPKKIISRYMHQPIMLGPSSPKQSQAQPNPLKPKNLTKLKTNQPKFTNLIHQKKRKKERKKATDTS